MMAAPMSGLILLGAIALGAGGAAMMMVASRLNRQALRRRVELVRPGAPQAREVRWRNRAPQSPSLMRPEASGMPAQQQREVSRRLARMGIPPRYAAVAYRSLHLLFAGLAGGFGAWLSLRFSHAGGSRLLPILVAVALFAIGWFTPQFLLRWMVRRRAKAAALGLPDALELLVVCVEAGLSLETGIDRIVGELQISQPALAAELAQTSADLKILPNRDEALANLAARVDVPSVRSVVATLTQTLRYGTPLAHAMRVVAAEMRTAALIDLEERANRLPAIMTVPMMLFIMPVIFLIVGGPAVLRLLDMMGHR